MEYKGVECVGQRGRSTSKHGRDLRVDFAELFLDRLELVFGGVLLSSDRNQLPSESDQAFVDRYEFHGQLVQGLPHALQRVVYVRQEVF